MGLKGRRRAPLWEAMKAYLEQGLASWHTPGHGGGRATWRDFYRRLGPEVFQMDLTEVPGLDNLQEPRGVIREAQERAAAFFGAGSTFFLVNGASAGIAAVFLATCRPGDVVLMPRYAHRSAFAGLILSGARPVYLETAWLPGLGMVLGVEAAAVKKALEDNPRAKLLLLVHPTYEGLVPPTWSLVELAHGRGVRVLVDAAHGAHFGLDPRLPPSPLALGADYVVHGTHKTLGAFTQAAMLHLRPGMEGREVEQALGLLQTTSPSYLLLASLDAARFWAEARGRRDWAWAVDRALELRQGLKNLGLPCLELEDVPSAAVAGLDVTRLVVAAAPLGMTGPELDRALRERGQEMELAADKYIVGILTPAQGQAAVKGLIRALEQIKKDARRASGRPAGATPAVPKAGPWPLPPVALTPREAFQAAHRSLPLEEAVGRVAAELVAPCPPGVALVVPGEVLTPETIERLALLRGPRTEIRVVDA
ncbi:MAG: aminotransferase class I/II-fold pyridoxal phosphate-dependent enzyme [Thermoanaerobacteraceae bacterium]|uniref:aminotransferase class I/II-fold pyridoxal phosphate-dependent enzyme n=1 Tax=Thermanaeromonas sp. C210 TaxID=2731925 RepID=UPI00155B728B|nr:aminotransferase class I/II-fold pyridoxal phosphate-dependent enzyme [Thermanaeromonas sp. C210]MBE3580868.1 aminotransferase class I/II-fold pyridoxal phosphate-dependent enzyme [Thermoanaerobacteraceae bacterium]GFN21720.1 arginine decarboxylase [Thermanaeromonas sp. C210]